MRGARRRTHSRRSAEIPRGAGYLTRRGTDSESGFKRLARRDPLQLLFLLLAAVVIITLPHRHQLGLAKAVRSTVLAPVLRLQGGFYDMRLTSTRVEELRAERDSLAERVLVLKDVEEENLRLRGLMGLWERGANRFRPANLYPTKRGGEVVARSFRLDVGGEAGVTADAPVIAPGGLVGVVRVTSGGQALGDFWTHPDFRVSAMTADGSVFGIISPLGETPLLMRLDGAPYQVRLTRGTELVTSGMGGVFPRGIPIGRVTEATGEEAGWARSYQVRPLVYPEAVREVMVLVQRDSTETMEDVWSPSVSEGNADRE